MGNQDDDRNDQKSEYLYVHFATKIYTYLFWPKLKELDNFFPYKSAWYLKFISSTYVDKYYHFWIIKILVPDLRGPTV